MEEKKSSSTLKIPVYTRIFIEKWKMEEKIEKKIQLTQGRKNLGGEMRIAFLRNASC